jgi:hypothetical protein
LVPSDKLRPDVPNLGVVAAEAVRQLSQLVLNDVLDMPDSIRVAPGMALELPLLQQYYYVSATDSVLSRTVASAVTNTVSPRRPAIKRDASAAGASGASGATGSLDILAPKAKAKPEVPNPPAPKGTAMILKDDDTDDDEDLDDEDDHSVIEEGADDEFQAIEEIEGAGTKRKQHKTKGKAYAM